MKFKKWKQSLTNEYKFLKALQEVCKQLKRIANSAGSDLDKYQQYIKSFQNSNAYKDYIRLAVTNMITGVANQNYKTWRQASQKAMKGQLLYKGLLQEMEKGLGKTINYMIEDNARLISTLPTDVSNKVVKNITALSYKGLRASEIAKIIEQETNKHSRASAKLIARTEVSKATTALTQARSQELGINWYCWRTALDGPRVRKAHRNMEDVFVNWSEPPSPENLVGEKSVGFYHAGNIWNCRCYPEPIIELDDYTWPHKVYYQGRIQKMTKNKFKELL
mgnify:CR=1 FL=1